MSVALSVNEGLHEALLEEALAERIVRDDAIDPRAGSTF